ncbi:MAG: hypothetical protein ACYC0M_15395 [Burkholderiales bacterium]
MGFKEAHEFAKEQVKRYKTEWRTVTGETYGEVKAATWCAEKSVFDVQAMDKLQQGIDSADTQLAAANQHLGALESDYKRHADAASRLNGLRQKSAQYARIQDKLSHDEADLENWQQKVEETRQLAAGGRKFGLVHDLAYALHDMVVEAQPLGIDRSEYVQANAVLMRYETEHGDIADEAKHDPEAADKLPEYEKALKLMQNAVANGKRDLSEADAAASQIDELEKALGKPPGEAEISAALKRVDEIKSERAQHAAAIPKLKDAERASKQADERTEKALAAHTKASEWALIADALAPDGIPGEMLAEALEPINQRLFQSAGDADWGRVEIHADMRITGAGERDYNLLSESEKWRVDAMIAEAVSHLSGIKLLMLDRVDCLDMKGREDLIAWLDILAQDGEIETALIFGTLKQIPNGLPDTLSAFWIENGSVVDLKKVA